MIKILIVEDEADIREEVMDWLMFEGYEVIGAANGLIGLEMAVQESPDMIISDLTMPKMNGFQLLTEIRSNPNTNQIPFIILTSAADAASIGKGINLGANTYLTKPFSHADVLNTVRSILES